MLYERPLPVVVIRHADHDVQQPLLLVQSQDLADFGRAAKNLVGAIEEDRFLGHRNDEAPLGGRRRFDVILAEADRRIGHAGPNLGNVVDDAGNAGDLFPVEPGGNGGNQPRHDEFLALVGLHDLGVDDLAGDVGEGGHVDAVARFLHEPAAARIERIEPLAAVGHQPLGQGANAEILGPHLPRGQRLAEVGDRLFGSFEFVTAFHFSGFDHRSSPGRCES